MAHPAFIVYGSLLPLSGILIPLSHFFQKPFLFFIPKVRCLSDFQSSYSFKYTHIWELADKELNMLPFLRLALVMAES